jgi:hypothetical protein
MALPSFLEGAERFETGSREGAPTGTEDALEANMAKRSSTTKRTSQSSTALESQILAFAEQLGYVAGTIETRADGLVDRKKLSRQLTTVRDGARRLLDQLATGVAGVGRKSAPKRAVRRARSGGTVDAPGKKHRKPAAAPPPPAAERARNALMQAAAHKSTRVSHRARQG